MIDINLPEPETRYRYCNTCGKTKRLSKTLFHWPDAECDKDEVKIVTGEMIKTFSFWYYECAWCKMRDTKLRRAQKRMYDEWLKRQEERKLINE